MTGIPTVIVDVDGTLVDVSGVRHYVLDDPRRKDFDSFHRGSALAPPHAEVVRVVQALDQIGLRILVLTSRKERWRSLTRNWLRKWDVPAHALGMRAEADDRRDDDVKRDLYIRARRLGLDPVLAIDDNPIVVDLWRSLDIPTVVVPGWVTP